MSLRSIDTGGVFDDETLLGRFKEASVFDGSNHISRATGSQWDHEALLVTKSGTPLIESYSQRQGVLPAVKEVSKEAAYEWLVRNDHQEAAVKYFEECGHSLIR